MGRLIRRAITGAVDHPVWANVAMIVIFIWGYLACVCLPVQFLPDFNPDVLVVMATRDNASAREMKEDVMKAIDPHLYGLENLDSIEANAKQGVCFWVLRFTVGEYNKRAVDKVRQRLDQANLSGVKYRIERPRMRHPVLSFVMTGPQRLAELVYYAKEAKRSLLDLGVDGVTVQGLEKPDIEWTAFAQDLSMIGVPMGQVAENLVGYFANDAMSTGGGALRLQRQEISPGSQDLGDWALNERQSVGVGGVLEIGRRFDHQSPRVFVHNKPAVSITVNRNSGGSDVFTLQKKYRQWRDRVNARWGSLVRIEPYEQTWKMLKYRIELLVGNGLMGLVLIVVLLGVFFHLSLARWIAAGIPICIAASCVMLYCLGGSINFLSTFAFVMALGVIVDDTIVISEQAYSEFQRGVSPRQAVLNACRLMFVPIMAASMTTVASFIPLLTIPGEYGKIMIDIPRVVICVLVASIVECFFILPRHLKGALENFPSQLPLWQQRVQNAVWHFQHKTLKRILTRLSEQALVVVSIGLFVVSAPFLLLQAGYISFSFFPSPPNNLIMLDVGFDSGVSDERVLNFLAHADEALTAANRQLSPQGSSVVEMPLQFAFQKSSKSLVQFNKGVTEDHASMTVGLTLPDQRQVSNESLIEAWYQHLEMRPNVKTFSITEPRAGPPVPDIKLLIKGSDPLKLKQAGQALKQKLVAYQGVHAIEDNMPYGLLEYRLALKDKAKAIGVDKSVLEREISARYEGVEIEEAYEDDEKITVRLRSDRKERMNTELLFGLLVSAQGQSYRLEELVTIDMVKDFANYYSYNGELGIIVSAETSADGSSTREIVADLQRGSFAEIEQTHRVKIDLETQGRSQAKALSGIRSGAMIALTLIYFVLAWVLRSYWWPLMVMMIIPVGISGALFGHYLLGMNMTILSIFGVFGLTGIVVNDAIILLHRFQRVYGELPMTEAMIVACTERFRAVVLTSITTIAGMGPLLLNKSLQAQFVIPLAVSMCSGLFLATVLLIVLLPALTALVEAASCVNH